MMIMVLVVVALMVVDGFHTDRNNMVYHHHSKHHHQQQQQQRQSINQNQNRYHHRQDQLLMPRTLSSSLLSYYGDGSGMETIRKRPKSTAVYLLLLLSLVTFVGDNVLHLEIFKSWYLYHNRYKLQWWQTITSTFCHGNKNHLSGNLFLLLLFGRSVEDELGSCGLVFSYFFCGVLSNIASLVLLPKFTVSMGASGAVFGLFAVSIVSRLSFRDILDWRKLIEVGVLGQFVITQFVNEAKTAASGGIVGINHVAHLAGASAGVIMVLFLRKFIHVLERQQ